MKVFKLKSFIFCYILIICDCCCCWDSIALNTIKFRNNIYDSPMLTKFWTSRRPLIITNEVSTIDDFPTFPLTSRKQSTILKHQDNTAIREKRTASIPSLTYYHSRFRMNLIKKEPKKRKSPCWVQMVLSLPVEYRYKFGICPIDCRYTYCDTSEKIALNDTLMFIAITVYYQLN